MCTVELQQIRKSYGKFETIHGVDLAMEDRDFVVFVGPSGCGKSTLLRLIAGLEDITSGRLLIDGEVVNHRTPKERGVAMVFQSYALYPHMTVFQNMAFGLELAKSDRATIEQRVKRAAEILQLTALLDRLPRQLSGGQRQRVAIGRAIVREPKLFLFDEPLSNLDASLRVQTRIEIAKLHQQMNATMAYVTHDQVEAMTLADKIVVLNAGQVEQVGSPLELYDHPANQFVATFIGSPRMNLLDAEVVSADATGAQVALPGGARLQASVAGGSLRPGQRVSFGIRPEHLVVGEGGLEAPVEVVEQLGESHYLHVRAPDGALLTVKGNGVTKLRPGASVQLGLPPHLCHMFTEAGASVPRRMH